MEEQSVAVQYFLPVTIAMIMLAMGLGLVVDDFRRIFEKPRAVVIGLGAQLVLLPMLGFAVAFGFGLRPERAVGRATREGREGRRARVCARGRATR
jgi:BASS family bile acid:Na+ symporter